MKLTGAARLATTAILCGGFLLALEEALAWSRLANLWDTDLISYLDNGEAFLNGNFQLFINPYWSPLYGILTALVLKLSAASVEMQLLTVRLTNVCIYLVLTASFVFLLGELKLRLEENFKLSNREQPKEASGVEVGNASGSVEGSASSGEAGSSLGSEEGDQNWFYSLMAVFLSFIFIYSSLALGQTMYGTPDLLASALGFTATALTLKLRRLSRSGGDGAMLTALLLAFVGALGYLSKAPMLSYSYLLLLALVPEALSQKQVRKPLLTAFVVLTILVAPYIAVISQKAGHLTFSDVWKVGQSWNIFLKQPIIHGRSPEFVHPTRLLGTKPEVYEFQGQFPGTTYAPWYAPSYWYEGVPLIIEWHEYIPRVIANALRYTLLFGGGLLILSLTAVFSKTAPLSRHALRATLPLWLPAAVGLGFIMLGIDVTVNSDRYYTPYLVPVYACIFLASSKPPLVQKRKVWLAATAPIVGFILIRLALVGGGYWPLLTNQKALGEGFQSVELLIPGALSQLGLKPGDRIAQLGSCRYFFARLAKLEIVADITDIKAFWQLSRESRQAIYNRLQALDVKALVQEPYLKEVPLNMKEEDLASTTTARDEGWQTIDENGRLIAVPEPGKRPSTFMVKLLKENNVESRTEGKTEDKTD
ncbi:MAG: hypothetical protein SFV17_20790 [Candidatus Obscuribacter sp.]|nr:hypothetical protein [Candidatus Obscuribacter sp.]